MSSLGTKKRKPLNPEEAAAAAMKRLEELKAAVITGIGLERSKLASWTSENALRRRTDMRLSPEDGVHMEEVSAFALRSSPVRLAAASSIILSMDCKPERGNLVIYDADWPVAYRSGRGLAHIRRLNSMGLEAKTWALWALLIFGWDRAFMPTTRSLVEQAVDGGRQLVESLRLVEWRNGSYATVWKTTHTGEKGERDVRLPGCAKRPRVGVPSPRTQMPCFRSVSADLHAKGPLRYAVDKCVVWYAGSEIKPLVHPVTVHAVGTGADWDEVRTASVYFDFEEPLRHVLQRALHLDLRRVVLVPLRCVGNTISAVWFALRDPYLEAIGRAMFGDTGTGAEVGISHMVCDYLGITKACADDAL